MKKIYFLVTVFLVSLLYGQENPLSLKSLHQVNTYNGGQLLHSAFDKNGNTVIAGFANGDFKIDGQSIPTVNTNDIFIYKSKADSFEKKWLNVFKTTLTSQILASELFTDQYNDTYFYLRYSGSITINNEVFNSENYTPQMGLLIKINDVGEIQWVQELDEIFNNISKKTSTTADFIFYVTDRKKILKFDRNTGALIEKKDIPLLIDRIKSVNDRLYMSGYGDAQTTYGNTSFNKEYFIASFDTDLNIINTLKSKTTDTETFSNIDFYDFFIDHNQHIFFIMRNKQKSISLLNNDQILITTQTSTNGNKIWLGKTTEDFSSVSWFTVNESNYSPIHPSDLSIFNKDENSFNIKINASYNIYIKFNGVTVTFPEKSLINIDKDGDYKSYAYFDYFKIDDYVNINDKEYILFNLFDRVQLSKKGDDNAFTLYKDFKITNNQGTATSRGTLISKNDNLYIGADISGVIENYFGVPFIVNKPSEIYSKLDKEANSLWHVVSNNTVSPMMYNPNNDIFSIGNKLDINQNNESILVSDCTYPSYIENHGSCYLTGTNMNYTYFDKSILVSKIDDNGSLIWKQFIIPIKNGYNNLINDLSVNYDKSGNIWLTGHGSGEFTYNSFPINLTSIDEDNGIISNFFVLKINSEGQVIFLKTYPKFISSKAFLNFDNNNIAHIYLNLNTGRESITFDNLSVESRSSGNQTIKIQMDQNGNILQLKNYTPIADHNKRQPHFVIDVKQIEDGEIIFGWTDADKTLDNVEFTNPYNSNFKYTNIISKINNTGQVLWSKPILSDSNINTLVKGNFITTDAQSNIYISSAWKGKIKYQDQEITLGNIYDNENILLKLDKNANLLQHKLLGIHNESFNISISSDNKPILFGNSYQYKIDNIDITSKKGDNMLLISLEEKELETAETYKKNPIVIYPNPTKDVINIKDNKDFTEVKIYDASAKLVLNQVLKNNQINVSELPKGVYYLELIGKEKAVVKFIKD